VLLMLLLFTQSTGLVGDQLPSLVFADATMMPHVFGWCIMNAMLSSSEFVLLLLRCKSQPGLASRSKHAGYPFFFFSNEVLLILWSL
jgi:hypothetical protein